MPDKLLVVSPHADDETIGCGGFMARTIRNGGSAHVIVATLGDTYFAHQGRVVPADERRAEMYAAARVGGWTVEAVLYERQELRLDALPQIELVSRIEALVADIRPNVVLIPYPGFHQDHVAVFNACMAVLRPGMIHNGIESVAMYEDPRIAWSHVDLRAGYLYVDVAEHLAAKLAAFRQYKSQCEEGEWRVYSAAGLERWARARGAECNMAAAEKFYVLRQALWEKEKGNQ